MPALFIYLIKVNIALLIFCAGYYAVLRHLTFYNLNRVYLVTAIIFSSLYPKINLANFLNRHQEIAKPIQVVVINWQQPVKDIAKTFWGHDIWFWLQAAFWLGVILFAIRLLMQLLSLYRLHKQSKPAQLQQYVIRVIKGDINPFSFWKNIYINPDNHPAQELGAILEHEQIHVSEWHTLDILLGEISAIFYWFNPGVWLMKRAIRENIEFITDNKIIQKGIDRKSYQYSLLNVNFGTPGNPIVNHFNISTIKKRIMMMNAKKSSSVNVTRYLFLIPTVMVLLLIFSVSKAEMNKAVKSSKYVISDIGTAITKISFRATSNISLPTTTERTKVSLLKAISLFTVQADTVNKIATDSVKKTVFFTNFKFNDLDKQDVFFARADTGKKITLTLKGSIAERKPDIYVNGVKLEGDLNNINPNTIESISVVKDKTVPPNGAIYVITKDHATAGLQADTIIVKSLTGKVEHVKITKPTDVADNEVTVVGYGSPRVTNIRINGKTIATGDKIKKIVLDGDTIYSNNITMVKGKKAGALDTLLRGLPGIQIAAVKNAKGSATRTVTVQGYPLHTSTAPINFSDKLIIINGKQALVSELKKISADKIESVSNLSAEAAKALYGDKGKNGVVIINTKK